MTDVLRVPPNSVESEQGVIGALLMDNGVWEHVGELTEADFYRHENRLVFAAAATLIRSNKPADTVTVYEQLLGDGKADEAGGLPYLSSLTEYMPSVGNVRRYAEIIREHALRRALISATDAIATLAFSATNTPASELIDQAQQQVMRLGEGVQSDDDWTEVYQGMVAHSELLERRHRGEVTAWPTGLADLDDYLEGGLRPGELVIVGARPSMGKTALGLTIGVHMAQERPVALLSMEMSKAEVNDRLTAMLGEVSMSAVKRPSNGEGLDWSRVMDGVERAKSLRLRISDKGGLNLNQVRSRARNAKRKGGLDVLVLDYIGLMTGLDAKANRNAQLGEISRGLKTLAKELQMCVLCLAQLNRQAEERPDQMPQMRDLRDSGEIEQDADVILFIKRPIMNDPELGPEWQHYAKLSVAKNRQGRCGLIDLSYLGERTQFRGWYGPAPVKASTVKTSRGMN